MGKYNHIDSNLMPKSNRKGYFVLKLRSEGYLQDKPEMPSTMKGVRKQAKIAAKQARQRKKIYINHLQKKIAELQQQVQSLKILNAQLAHKCQLLNRNPQKFKQRQVRTTKSDDMIKQQRQRQNSTKARFEGLFKQIKTLSVNIESNNVQEVSRSLSVLRDKYGISGRERLKFIDEQFDKIVHIMMPLHYRLLMQNSLNNRQFYTLLGSQYTKTNLAKLQNHQRQILLSIRPQIIKQKQQYDNIISSLALIRNKIRAQNYKCQGIVDQIQDRVDPIFVGRLLLELDFCRTRENFQGIYPVNEYGRARGEYCDVGVREAREAREVRDGQGQARKREEIQEDFRFQDDMQIINSLFS